MMWSVKLDYLKSSILTHVVREEEIRGGTRMEGGHIMRV